MKKQTKIGIWEEENDNKWTSPSHQITIEVDNPRGGTYRKSVQGIKSAKVFGSHVRGKLTDKKIARYEKEGWYEMRKLFHLKREKRLVWDGEKQEFVMR